ncbi:MULTISPECIES: membrane lipoprotein lipid attachment site-containing protein [Vibrio]|uniref:membrane lipoprotein lipid attachment site-containing protein n=1 Tax=Vibrio TaxID=662 RepID=UPI001120CC5D|nr:MULTISPECIES: membrane lipoprotein lipid attachment site-containing protein [Vibrio]EGQ7819256.1 lipoprotein [Vibrio parahaemolyticus]EGQ8705383.1 hypothetical protein [Vibrio parahaemolyticus]EGQ8941614.1 hypothetical protein [Vibrio parahaemolyticus]EGQ8948345.1 hypothetical protein [Vibrio parahaemolyticus]EGQ8967494.1 hypothetical protein [Vibrio parahaemolyticus]
MNKYLFPLGLVAMLSGCQTTIEASQYSVLDPDVNFYASTPIVVSTFDENDLSSKFYIRSVIDALKERGFTNVYSSRELVENQITPVAAAYIKLEEKYDTYTYESADYGMVDSGYSTTNCTGFGITATCNTTKQKTFGVTGKSTKTGSMVYHSFALHYYDLATEKKVLFTMGSTFEKSCNSDFLYNFLIDETISRTDFERPVDYDYKIKLPEGVQCK